MFKGFKRYLENQTTSKATIAARLSDVKIYFDNYNKIDTDTVQRFVHNMVQNGYDSKTIARRVSSLKKFAEYKGIVLGKIDTPKLKRKVPQIISPQELNKLVTVALNYTYENDGFDKMTLQVMIILFNYMIRRSGVLDIKDSDIDFSNNNIYIHNKGGNVIVKHIVFGMSKIKEYIELKKKFGIKSEYLLVRKYGIKWNKLKEREMYNMLYEFTNEVIGKKVNPHQFRHSVATSMLNNGVDIRTLQEILNHKDISTTQFYTQIAQNRIDKVYNEFHPVFGGVR